MSSSSRSSEGGTEDDTAVVTSVKGSRAETPGGRTESGERVGERIGDRYVVIEQLGVGGMGRVLRAYDHKLQREVALKQLRAESLGALGEARLLREARAMAQLSHANVVAVYDVDIAGSEVTIAMELVVGQTASQWLDAESRGPDEIIAVFVDAGRGIAAAHRVSLVHRDFKPQNILIGTDGEVKVTDFGLAKLVDGDGSDDPSPDRERPEMPRTTSG